MSIFQQDRENNDLLPSLEYDHTFQLQQNGEKDTYIEHGIPLLSHTKIL